MFWSRPDVSPLVAGLIAATASFIVVYRRPRASWPPSYASVVRPLALSLCGTFALLATITIVLQVLSPIGPLDAIRLMLQNR
jgi:hypothetical protein